MNLYKRLKPKYRDLLLSQIDKFPTVYGDVKEALQETNCVGEVKYKNIADLLNLELGIKSPFDLFIENN